MHIAYQHMLMAIRTQRTAPNIFGIFIEWWCSGGNCHIPHLSLGLQVTIYMHGGFFS